MTRTAHYSPHQQDNMRADRQIVPLGLSAIMFIGLLITTQSKIVWYDFRILAVQGGQEFELSNVFLVWSIALLPFVAYFFGKDLHRYIREPFVLALLTLNLSGAILGFLLGNAPEVIVQDIWKYLFPVVGFVAAYATMERFGVSRPMRWLFLVTFAAMIFRFVYFAIDRQSIFDVRYGGVLELFAVAYAAAMIFQRKGLAQIGFLAALILCVLTIGLGDKRTTALLALFIISLSFFFSMLQGKLALATFVPLILTFSGVLGFVTGVLDFSAGVDALGKLNPEDVLDFSGEVQRQIEIEVVVQALKDYPLGMFFGFGSGAEFQLPTFFSKTLQEYIHSVHFTPAAMIYRHGIFGIGVYLFTALYGLRFVLRNDNNPANGAVNSASLYKIGALIASLAIYGMVDDFLIGICTAALVFHKRNVAGHVATGMRHA